MEAYRLPDLFALLPEKPGGEINPHFKEFEAEFNAWLEKRLSRSCARQLYQCDSPLLVAVVYPLASPDQLRGIGDYFAIGFLLDDMIDHAPRKDLAAVSQIWLKTLRDRNGGEVAQDPLIDMLRSELLLTIRPVVGSFHWSQFINENEKLLKGMVREMHDREAYLSKSATLDIQSYMNKRHSTIGTRPCFVFLRSTRRLYIPDDVLAHPNVLGTENATTEMMILTNDIHSFKKEYRADGAFHNVLTAIRNDPETAQLDFQGRLDYAKEMFEGALERFHACRRGLPFFSPEMDEHLSQYADGLIDLAIGNVQWSRVVRRYGTFMNDEDRRDNIMRMALGGCTTGTNEQNAPFVGSIKAY